MRCKARFARGAPRNSTFKAKLCGVGGPSEDSLDDCERAMMTTMAEAEEADTEAAASAVRGQKPNGTMDTIFVAKKEVVNQSPNLLQQQR